MRTIFLRCEGKMWTRTKGRPDAKDAPKPNLLLTARRSAGTDAWASSPERQLDSIFPPTGVLSSNLCENMIHGKYEAYSDTRVEGYLNVEN